MAINAQSATCRFRREPLDEARFKQSQKRDWYKRSWEYIYGNKWNIEAESGIKISTRDPSGSISSCTTCIIDISFLTKEVEERITWRFERNDERNEKNVQLRATLYTPRTQYRRKCDTCSGIYSILLGNVSCCCFLRVATLTFATTTMTSFLCVNTDVFARQRDAGR